jgi:hypothetical protein
VDQANLSVFDDDEGYRVDLSGATETALGLAPEAEETHGHPGDGDDDDVAGLDGAAENRLGRAGPGELRQEASQSIYQGHDADPPWSTAVPVVCPRTSLDFQ